MIHRKPALLGGLLLSTVLPGGVDVHAQEVIARPGAGDVITIRPEAGSLEGQGQFVGIFGSNSGARGLSLRRLVIPPGGKAKPHRHVGHESAVYLVQGTVETRYGPRLERRAMSRAGDFLFIPAGVVHQPINLSTKEAAIAIEARNEPSELGPVEFLDQRP